MARFIILTLIPIIFGARAAAKVQCDPHSRSIDREYVRYDFDLLGYSSQLMLDDELITASSGDRNVNLKRLSRLGRDVEHTMTVITRRNGQPLGKSADIWYNPVIKVELFVGSMWSECEDFAAPHKVFGSLVKQIYWRGEKTKSWGPFGWFGESHDVVAPERLSTRFKLEAQAEGLPNKVQPLPQRLTNSARSILERVSTIFVETNSRSISQVKLRSNKLPARISGVDAQDLADIILDPETYSPGLHKGVCKTSVELKLKFESPVGTINGVLAYPCLKLQFENTAVLRHAVAWDYVDRGWMKIIGFMQKVFPGNDVFQSMQNIQGTDSLDIGPVKDH